MASATTLKSPVARPIAVFDFDGTIVDSLDVMIDEYNRVAARFRVKPLNRADMPRLRSLRANEALKEHNVSFWKLPFLVHTMRGAMRRHLASLPACEGMLPALRALVQAGGRCSVLSTNSSANIQGFLAQHDMHVFEHVVGGASMFGKASALRALIRRAGFDRDSVFYVGDEVRDVAAARAAGVRSVAVGWGYAARDALVSQNPDFLVDTPEQLLALLRPTA
jgi:phosphoglycolate phosphatase